jgi:hypothetical protein
MKIKKFLSSFALKRIAIISMIIDHIGGIVIDGLYAPYVNSEGCMVFTSDLPKYIQWCPIIKNICEILGSVAFPLFCFLIVQGFIHTHSKEKYMLRLGGFALISEIPYDIAHYGKLFNFNLQNVLFTLFFGVLTLYFIERIQNKFKENMTKNVLFTIGVMIIGMGVVYLIRSEYVFLGVFAISLMYLFRNKNYLYLVGFAPLLIVSPWVLLAIVPLLLYNGQKGNGSKYFFYIFYPTHLLVLAWIANLLASRGV